MVETKCSRKEEEDVFLTVFYSFFSFLSLYLTTSSTTEHGDRGQKSESNIEHAPLPKKAVGAPGWGRIVLGWRVRWGTILCQSLAAPGCADRGSAQKALMAFNISTSQIVL